MILERGLEGNGRCSTVVTLTPSMHGCEENTVPQPGGSINDVSAFGADSEMSGPFEG